MTYVRTLSDEALRAIIWSTQSEWLRMRLIMERERRQIRALIAAEAASRTVH